MNNEKEYLEFEKLFNKAIIEKGYQYLSNKLECWYWYRKGQEQNLKKYLNLDLYGKR